MLPGRSVQPLDILEIDLMSLGVKSITNNEYILFMVDKAPQFPFAFLFSSKNSDGVPRQFLQLCLTFGIPKAIRADGGRKVTADISNPCANY